MIKQILCTILVLYHLVPIFKIVTALNIVMPGGTGQIGQLLTSKIHDMNKQHKVTILSRNAFLAATPSRVSSDFGWIGAGFLKHHKNTVKLRDWDGGDLLDIVGCDWMGWQEDTLTNADVVINLVGGFTQQRVMACERIVRESLNVNRNIVQITLSPIDDDLNMQIKKDRVKQCEELVSSNCLNHHCIRVEVNDLNGACDKILSILDTI